eukprot:367853-Rhodomonas_salina.8
MQCAVLKWVLRPPGESYGAYGEGCAAVLAGMLMVLPFIRAVAPLHAEHDVCHARNASVRTGMLGVLPFLVAVLTFFLTFKQFVRTRCYIHVANAETSALPGAGSRTGTGRGPGKLRHVHDMQCPLLT